MNHFFDLTENTKITCNVNSKPIQKIIDILKRDISNRLTKCPESTEPEIFLEILGDAYNELECEQYAISFPTNSILRIQAKDELGVIYGALHISEKYMDIHPFDFWNDRPGQKTNAIKIPTDEFVSEVSKVRFRGWFVNDEVLLNEWDFGSLKEDVWEILFETLLRCNGNMIIPGTDYNSRKYRSLASDMGLWITHHHAEPLGAEMFLRVYPDCEASYYTHEDLFIKIWEDGIKEQKHMKVVWNIGFRGQGDKAFWENDPNIHTLADRGRLIERVVEKQCELVRKHVVNPVFCTNLYGEILELYNVGYLKFPGDVIKIWGDSGYGKMVSRRQGNHNPRITALADKNDSGANGIYYHASFYDLQASNHITMSPNPPGFISEELNTCMKLSMDKYWIVNCGNVKPHAYILDLIKETWVKGCVDSSRHLESYIKLYFGESCLTGIKEVFMLFFQSTIQYGPNPDEKAGEQFYHHPARNIISEWIKGNTTETVESLIWATGEMGFAEQVSWFKEKCQVNLELWETLALRCEEIISQLPLVEARRFNDMFFTQVLIHCSGCKGLISLCTGYDFFRRGEYAKAFVYASNAMNEYEQGYIALQNAEHDKWIGFYKNDCLTDIQLTVYYCDNLRRYIRMIGESPNFYSWERKYLFDKCDKNIILLTNTQKSLSDNELCNRLSNCNDIKRIN